MEAVVANDLFTANATAISVGEASTATISGNTITGSTADAIVVSDAEATITDNTISGSGGAAISADPNSVVEQSGNSFDANAGGDLVGWTGLTTAFAQVIPALTGADLIFTWEATAQQFRSFNADALSFLNNLEQFNAGDGVWLRLVATVPLEWEQPIVDQARSVLLQSGFNLVTWTGPDATSVVDAIAGFADALNTLFVWAAVAQRFLSFNSVLPPSLNTAKTLQHGDGVWINVSRDVTWQQPAP